MSAIAASEALYSGYNAALAESWPDARWSSWFRAACDSDEKRDTRPLKLHPEARLADSVEAVYIALSEPSRYAMRIGLSRAIASWTPAHYSTGVLARLGWIMAQIRAQEAIPAICQILKDYRSILLVVDDDADTGVEDLIAILAGFVPDAEGLIEAVFSDLLFDDEVAPQLAATLAVAAASARRTGFADAFNRFFVLRSRNAGGFFADEVVLKAFVDAVSLRAIEKSIDELSSGAYDYFMRTAVAAGILTSRLLMGQDSEVGGRSSGERFRFPRVADAVAEAAKRYDLIKTVAPRQVELVASGESILNAIYREVEASEDEAVAS